MDPVVIPRVEEVAQLTGAELDRALVDLEVARRRLEASYIAVIDRADDTGRFHTDGHASVRGWTIALTNAEPIETRRRLQTMRALRDLPDARARLAEGSIGVEQVRAIARLHARPQLRELIVAGDTTLVAHARKDFATFAEVLQRWAQFGDPTGAEKDHARAHEQRDAIVFERDGIVRIHATCGTGQGAALMEMFQHQCDAEFLTDWETAKADGIDLTDDIVGDPLSRLARTEAQRRMDALHRLIVRGAAAPDAQTPEPLVNIVITQAEYETELAAMMRDGDESPPATVDDIDTKKCETATGITISTRDAVIASMIGYVRRVVVDSAGRVIDLGRRRRFTGAARDAVLLDGRRCLWPGCGRNNQRNQIDHTHEHARGGSTTPHNGGPACGRHNRLKSQGYTAHRHPDGTWHIHRPDGTELTQPAAA